jgi:hypothetical protein
MDEMRTYSGSFLYIFLRNLFLISKSNKNKRAKYISTRKLVNLALVFFFFFFSFFFHGSFLSFLGMFYLVMPIFPPQLFEDKIYQIIIIIIIIIITIMLINNNNSNKITFFLLKKERKKERKCHG